MTIGSPFNLDQTVSVGIISSKGRTIHTKRRGQREDFEGQLLQTDATMLDTGVIVARDARLGERRFKPGDEAIVEWRALTVALLDELAPKVRALLGRSASEMPLASILEGGTWAAGREIALERREGGVPPLRIESDGTVF